MKALLIADDDDVIKKIQTALSDDGFDVITYRWLLKALDNIEEISPEAIIVSASSYPRHWKTLAQFAKSEITGFLPKIVLYSERDFSEEDIKKSEILGIDGIFYSVESEGLKGFKPKTPFFYELRFKYKTDLICQMEHGVFDDYDNKVKVGKEK